MSRSHRKHPISGITTIKTEKYAKRYTNRVLRNRVKMSVKKEEEIQPALREVSNPWCGLFGKDGKARFDPQKHPKLMRK